MAMPNPGKLKEGDKIRILSVPVAEEGAKTPPLETAEAQRWMVGKEFAIDWVDEYGPFVSFSMPEDEYEDQQSMVIADFESWEYVDPPNQSP